MRTKLLTLFEREHCDTDPFSFLKGNRSFDIVLFQKVDCSSCLENKNNTLLALTLIIIQN